MHVLALWLSDCGTELAKISKIAAPYGKRTCYLAR